MVNKVGGGRWPSISMTRLFAMVMIIVCHMFQYYDYELCRWFNVGVQVFFVISGYLYASKEIDNPVKFIRKSFTKILIPYWIFLVIAIILYLKKYPQFLSFSTIVKTLLCAGTIHGLGHLWFVGYILFCYLLTPYLFWIRKSIPSNTPAIKIIVIYISIIVIFQVIEFAFNSYFLPDRISCYIIGFFAADLISRFGERFKVCLMWIFLIVALITNGIEVYSKYIASIVYSGIMMTLFNALCRYAHLFLGVALFFVMERVFQKINHSSVLKASDKYSYPIYIVHLLFILSPFSLMDLTRFNMFNWIIILASVIVSGVILQRVSDMIFSKSINNADNEKKTNNVCLQ